MYANCKLLKLFCNSCLVQIVDLFFIDTHLSVQRIAGSNNFFSPLRGVPCGFPWFIKISHITYKYLQHIYKTIVHSLFLFDYVFSKDNMIMEAREKRL